MLMSVHRHDQRSSRRSESRSLAESAATVEASIQTLPPLTCIIVAEGFLMNSVCADAGFPFGPFPGAATSSAKRVGDHGRRIGLAITLDRGT